MNKMTVRALKISDDKIEATINYVAELKASSYISTHDFTKRVTELVATEFFKRNGETLLELTDKEKLSSAILLEISRKIVAKNM